MGLSIPGPGLHPIALAEDVLRIEKPPVAKAIFKSLGGLR